MQKIFNIANQRGINPCDVVVVVQKAPLAVSTITISPEREKAVDFTQPFFSLGFKIVMKKTDREEKVNTWGLLGPFENTLWIAIISSSVIVGIVV